VPVKNSAKPLSAKSPAKVRDFMDDNDDGFTDWAAGKQSAPQSDSAFPFADPVLARPAPERPAPPPAAPPPESGVDSRARDRLIRLMIAAGLILVWTIAAIAFFAREGQQPIATSVTPASDAAAAPLPVPPVTATRQPAASSPPAAPVSNLRASAVGTPSPPPRLRQVDPARLRAASARRQATKAERSRSVRRQASHTSSAATAAPARAATVTCILPSGQDVAMSQAACRARSGLVYR
jgi:hypothetical protein